MTVILFSGGADSVVLMERARIEHRNPVALFVDYGQPAVVPERRIVIAYCREHGIKLYFSTLSLHGMGDMFRSAGAAIVPARNMVFLSLAANLAMAIGCDSVEFGANADDVAYADCSREFTASMAAASAMLGVSISAPLVATSKGEIVAEARTSQLEWWSCYTPQLDGRPCLKCAACLAVSDR